MKVLVAINGAGFPVYESYEDYEARYDDSWVVRLWQRATGLTVYFQGPRVITESMAITASHVADWIFANTDDDDEIAFAGYSRGGATCLLAAYNVTESWLYSGSRRVTAIGLFDPVANDSFAQEAVSTTDFGSTPIRIARCSDRGLMFPALEVPGDHVESRVFTGSHADLGGTTDTSNYEAYHYIGEFLQDHEFVNFSSP